MTKSLEREFFPAIDVNNKVVWVNPKILLPFNIQIGEKSDLGAFTVNPDSNILPKIWLGFENIHHRAGFLSEIVIADQQGIKYCGLDLKGIGYVTNPKGKNSLRVYQVRPRSENDSWGIWRKDKAEREIKITEDLISNGVRTYRIAAVIELKEIALPYGEVIPIEQAINIGMINPEEIPVIGLRIYRNRERIRHSDINPANILNKAKTIIEKELDRILSWEDYLTWFAQTLGENLAKMHQCGYWHGWVSPHNVTLACEIVDFGFGEGNKKLENLPFIKAQQHKQADFMQARNSLNTLFLELVNLNLVIPSKAVFLKTFETLEKSYK